MSTPTSRTAGPLTKNTEFTNQQFCMLRTRYGVESEDEDDGKIDGEEEKRRRELLK